MSKIAIIGTSHVASLKTGWDQFDPSHPDISVEFLGSKGSIFWSSFNLTSDLTFRVRKRAHGKRENLEKRFGRSSIKLADVDAVLLVGVGDPFGQFSELASRCDVSGIRETEQPTLLSIKSCDILFKEIAHQAMPGRRWKNWANPKLFLSYPPLPSEDCGTARRNKFIDWDTLISEPVGTRALIDRFLDVSKSEMAKVGITFLRQPSKTRTEMGLTRPEFKSNAKRADGSNYPLGNFTHMNGDFGALILEDLFAQLPDYCRKPEA